MWLEEESLGGTRRQGRSRDSPISQNFRKTAFSQPPALSWVREENLHKSWEVITKPELPQPQVISSQALMGLCIKAPWSKALAEPRAEAQITQNHPESIHGSTFCPEPQEADG